MTLVPKSERRVTHVVMGMLAFSATFSYAFTMQEQFQRVNGVPIDMWPWLTTALFLIVVLLIAVGLLVMKREFVSIAGRMDRTEKATNDRMDKFETAIQDIWKQVNHDTNRITGIGLVCELRHTEGRGEQ